LLDTYDAQLFYACAGSVRAYLKGVPDEIPFIVFHEATLPASFKADFPWVQFVEIEFKMPDYPPEITAQIPERFHISSCSFSMGYRHMCRFFSGEMFKTQAHILSQFDYVVRIDADAAILSAVDVAKSQAGAVYGYRIVDGDDPL